MGNARDKVLREEMIASLLARYRAMALGEDAPRGPLRLGESPDAEALTRYLRRQAQEKVTRMEPLLSV